MGKGLGIIGMMLMMLMMMLMMMMMMMMRCDYAITLLGIRSFMSCYRAQQIPL